MIADKLMTANRLRERLLKETNSAWLPILEAVAALPLMTATDFAARKRWEDRTAFYLAA